MVKGHEKSSTRPPEGQGNVSPLLRCALTPQQALRGSHPSAKYLVKEPFFDRACIRSPVSRKLGQHCTVNHSHSPNPTKTPTKATSYACLF